MEREITISYKKRKINLATLDCNLLQKFIGLMFSRREKAKILLFGFKKKIKISIHSFFVFYKFAAIWLDEKNRVVDFKIVKPFSPYVSHKNLALKLVEIPINRKYRRVLERFKY